MNIKLFTWLAKNDEDLSQYEIGIFDGEGKLDSLNILPESFSFQNSLLPESKGNKDPICLIVTKEKMIFGVVRDTSSSLKAVIGPAFIGAKDLDAFSKIMSKLKPAENDKSKIFHSIEAIPVVSALRFRQQIWWFYAIVNHDLSYLEKKELLKLPTDKIFQETYKSELSLSENQEVTGGCFAKYFEDLTQAYIRNGQPEKLREYLPGNYKERTLLLEMDQLRAFKDRVIAGLAVEVRTAIEANVNPDVAYSLQDMFISKAEKASSLTELEIIYQSALVSLCTYVGQAKSWMVSNPTIKRVLKYLNVHIYEKVTPTRISKDLSVSLSYLSSRFRSETGLTLVRFISLLKIEEAKKMLVFTNKSLAEISNMLSFSSQSYFQNVFKKETKTTPKEYREVHHFKGEQ
jgi:AraC-like DNA-binding protein